MAAYIDLSEKHGHRDDHGFACGAEFNVKISRRINIPDFVREQLSQGEIDEIWWEEAGSARDSLKDALVRRYKWIGELTFVGRGPGWLAIEDTGCRSRNWDTIGKVVDQYLKSFIKSMEAPKFWRDIKGVDPAGSSTVHHSSRKAPQARQHATKKKSQQSSAKLDREIAEALGTRPINRRKHVRHFSEWTDKIGRTHYAVTYEDRSGHAITREELERFRQREARG